MASEQLDIVVKLVDEATASLQKIKDEVGGLGDSVDSTSKKATSFTNILRGGLVALGTGALLNAVKGVTLEVINQAAAFEQTEIAFTTLLGSGEAAATFLNQLADFAAKTPFSLEGLTQASQRLLNMGIELESIIPMMTSVGDVVAALGGGSVEIDRVTVALSQMSARGKVSANEMNQLAEVGIPGWELLATTLGTTKAEAMKMAEQGNIASEVFIDAFVAMEGPLEKMSGAMEAQSRTWNGLMSTVIDSVKAISREVGGPLLDTLKPALEWLTGALLGIIDELEAKGFAKFFEDHKTVILALAGAIGGVLAGAFIGLMVVIVPIIWPILAIGVALGLVGAAIGALVAYWPDIKEFFGSLWDDAVAKVEEVKQTIEDFFNGLVTSATEIFQSIKDAVTGKIQELKDTAMSIWQGLVDGLTAIWNGVVTVLTAVWGAIVAVFTFWIAFVVGLVVLGFEAMGIDIVAVWETIKTSISAAWTWVGETLSTGLEWVRTTWNETWQWVSDFASEIWDGIVAWISEKMDFISGKVTEGVNTVSGVWQSVWNAISTFTGKIWEDIKKWFSDAIASISSTFSPWVEVLKGLWTSMWDAVVSGAMTAWETAKGIVKDSINWIIEKVNTLIEAINTVARKGAGVLGFDAPQISTIPLLAQGGNIVTAGSAIVGEAGPERIDLPRGARVTPLTGDGTGQTIVININNPLVMNDDDIMERLGNPLVEILKQHTAIV